VDEDIDCRIDPIHHASRREHIWEHIDWILQRIQTTVLDGKELWRHMSDFFPSLICCTEVEKQMANLPKLALASITRGLFHLNAFCVSWRSGGFDANGVGCNVSPDSPSTLQKYGDQREFTCPGGQRRVFSWHVKAGKWRIYFDPAAGVGHLFIGYVGGHLRTVEFN
jgi:hypothetical protein